MTFQFQQVFLANDSVLKDFPVHIFLHKKQQQEQEEDIQEHQDDSQILQFLASRKIAQKQDQEDALQVTKNQVWEQEAFLFSFIILKKFLSVNKFLVKMQNLPNQFKERQRFISEYQKFEFKLEMMHSFQNPTNNQYMKNLDIVQIDEHQFQEFDKPKDIPEKDQNLENVQPQNFQLIKKKLFIQQDPFKNLDYFELLDSDSHNEFMKKVQDYINAQSKPASGQRSSNAKRGFTFLKYDALKHAFFESKMKKDLIIRVEIPSVQEERVYKPAMTIQLSVDQIIQCFIDNKFLALTIFEKLKSYRVEQYRLERFEKLFFDVQDIYVIQILCYRVRSRILEAMYNDIKIDQEEAEVLGNEFLNKQNYLDGIEKGKEIEQNHIQIPLLIRNLEFDRIGNRDHIYYQELMLFAQQILRLIFCNDDPQFRLISCFQQQAHFESNDKCPKPIQRYVEFLSLYKEDISFPVLINTMNLYPFDTITDVRKNVEIFVDYMFVYLRDQQITKELKNQVDFKLSILNNFKEANNSLYEEYVTRKQKEAHKMNKEELDKLDLLQKQFEKTHDDMHAYVDDMMKKKGRKLNDDEFNKQLQLFNDRRDQRNTIMIKDTRLI